MEKNSYEQKRRYDLDWIRVLATLVVFLYHCSMFFNPFPWHIKNSELNSSWVLVFSLFVGSWIMPIFFVISGISMVYALRKRKLLTFIKERFVRLGVPLIMGVLLLTPPQIYIERIVNNQFKGDFLGFYPHFFDGVYLDFGGTGNFAFFGLHLWYLLVLLLFSLLCLPLFKKFPSFKKVGTIHFLTPPLLLFLAGVVNTQKLGGWDLFIYLLLFIYGFYFFSSPTFVLTNKRLIKYSILVAVASTLIYIVWFMNHYPQHGSIESTIFYGIRTLNCWSLLLIIFYLANKFLSHNSHFLQYGSEASMPFYVIHQPVIVIVGYFIHDLNWAIPVKLLILIGISFAFNILIYHFVIRHLSVTRIIFGLKSKETKQVGDTEKLSIR
ncbi:peptidoglycan/LPS O-acetylase OafA/YrhL [Bacillus mesophilus]|uniref:Acyltransferase n=1 Tax=Bacillus mesophilus TaxID=1808955 RepID=A0A6M0QBM3_9BACI|nr:acyltransferase [Bacillus mesophilus]MBM7663021.1 peptidoglycan/LPS O-acetylase OafA/YrhL [Bacillus mesophilus]NEY73657.1 acyltransferase [Bacillus mesophilus]